MEIITEEPLKITSQLLIPLILVIVTGFIPVIIKMYLSVRDKNKYIKILKDNFHSVKEFLFMVKYYKIILVYCFSYVFFVVGIVVGFFLELAVGTIIGNVFAYTLDINYIGKLLNLSPTVVFLNGVTLMNSCFHIGIIIIIILFIICCKFFNSKKLLTPKIDEDGTIALASHFVYPLFWLFIGMMFGLYSTIILYLIKALSKFSIIDNNFSFDRELYDLTITYLMYPEVHVFVYVTGFLLSLTFIVSLYHTAKKFKENFIKSLTDIYKYDFPYIKIKTGSGEIKGQLRDILNDLVTLSENDILKIVQWDKIETMEICQKNKTEDYIINDVLK